MDRRASWAGVALAAVLAAAIYLGSRGDAPKPVAGESSVEVPAEAALAPVAAPATVTAKAPANAAVALATSEPPANPYEYLHSLALIAFEGNADAQYQLARELALCNVTLALVRKEKDPEAALWNLPDWPQARRERLLSEYRRCKPLLEKDPFAELPARAGGYGYRYWADRAAEAGHPVALVKRAMRDLADQRAPHRKAARDRATALDDLARAATSGNADALLTMGIQLSMDGAAAEDEAQAQRGFAFMLVACQQGADCGNDSRILPMADCIDYAMPECAPNMDFESMLAQDLDPAKYAAAYAESQRLSQDLRARETLQPWLDQF